MFPIPVARARRLRPLHPGWRSGIIVWLLCLLVQLGHAAAPVVVVKDGEYLPLAGNLDVLRDGPGIDPQALLAGNHDKDFQRFDEPSLPFLSEPLWLRFRIANATANPRLVLSLHEVLYTDALLLYNRASEDETPDPVQLQSGLSHSGIWQDWQYYDIGFPLSVPVDEMRTVYLRLHAPYPLLINPRITDEVSYHRQLILQASWGHLMVGIMMGVLAYLLVILCSVRDMREVHYCLLFVLVSFMILLCSRGYLLRALPSWNWLYEHLYTLLIAAQGFTYIAFSRQHFKTRSDFPAMDLLLRFFLYLTAALFVISIPIPPAWGALAINLLGFLLVVFLCIISVYIWANSDRHLTVYITGTLVFLFACILATAEHAGFINLGGLSRTGYETAICLQAVLFALALAEKVTELRDLRQQEAIQAAEIAAETLTKNTLLAKMSHELRTPMNGLLGMVQLMERTPLNDQQQHYMQVMRNAGRMLLGVIDDVLDYSRIVAGQLRIDRNDFSLLDLLGDIESLYTPQARQKALNLRFSINTDNPVLVRGDGMRLRQVLSNLVSNAIKFTPQGTVTVRLWVELCSDTRWLLHGEVEDTGIGMEPEQVERLFHRVAQADGGRHFGGSGLGLVICRQLVAMMGGTLHAESAAGYGTLLRFHVAVEPPAGSSRRGDEMPQCRILVAEDDPSNREVILGMLEQLGYTATCVDNGRRAVDAFCQTGKSWDLVLLDVEMPVLDGISAAIQMRQWEGEQCRNAVPLIGLTAHASAAIEERVLQAGMDDILVKPVDMLQLQGALARWLPADYQATLFSTLVTPAPPG